MVLLSLNLLSLYMFFIFFDLLHAPFVSHNLISIEKLGSDSKIIVEFIDISIFVKDILTQNVLANGKVSDGLYSLDSKLVVGSQSSNNVVPNTNIKCANVTTGSIFLYSIKTFLAF